LIRTSLLHLGFIAVGLTAAAFLLTGVGRAEPVLARALPVEEHPPIGEVVVETDTCLACHVISTDEISHWVPPVRWTLFLAAGAVFGFGIYRASSLWRERRRFRPLLARAVDWLDERYQFVGPLQKVLAKPVKMTNTRWFYCLGGLTFLMFAIQAVTGIMLSFYYKPTPEAAYASIQYIMTEVNWGAPVRTVHHWAANGMIVLCVAHMARVFISGAYRPPRELTWVSGALLLIITLAFGFTGYLLPWDQRAYWATTVGTEIGGAVPDVGTLVLIFLRAGWDVSAATLSRFYSLHVILLPIATLAFMGAHFLMIRRQGIADPL
jgi:hypothetical protein